MQDGQSIAAGLPYPEFKTLRENGYSFWYLIPEEDEDTLTVEVHHAEGVVARAEFTDMGSVAICQNVAVNEQHQRRRIASTMYALAEAIFKKSLTNFWATDARQSAAARALWENQNRIFGR